MATNLTCRLGVVSQGLDDRLKQLSGLPGFIHDKLLFFSHGDINLDVRSPVVVPDSGEAGAPVSALQLHNQLLAINQNPLNGPLHSICLLLADSYAGLPGAFGIMFDRGFVTQDDPNSAEMYLARPRQGCAVFLGQIAVARTAAQFSEEVSFTAVHELGHVFNLQHDETCLNFMQISDPHQAYGPPAYLFTPHQQDRLDVCSSDPNVMPGSSIFDSDGAYNLDTGPPRPVSDALKLELSIARTSFWRFEPVQIEIGLSLGGSAGQPISVPALLDPSQDRFRLMIENDRGERALYRSPYRVCGGSGTLTIAQDSPYRRDFPIFGQAGGYTFRRAGRHVVRAELDLGDVRLISNDVVVDVRPEVGLGALDRELRSTLSEPGIGRLLFHREDHGEHIALRRLARYVERVPDVPCAGELNYALARAALKLSGSRAAPEMNDRAMRWLDRALSCSDIGPHPRAKATRLLHDLEQRDATKRRRRRTAGLKKPGSGKAAGKSRRRKP
nr:hypothetical protein [uncultured Rhodopila sp.]